MLYIIIDKKNGRKIKGPMTLLEAEAKLTLYKNWFSGIDKVEYVKEAAG